MDWRNRNKNPIAELALAEAFVNTFKKYGVYVGLIKRMEYQHASPIQIRNAIEKHLDQRRAKLNDSTRTQTQEGQDNMVEQE